MRTRTPAGMIAMRRNRLSWKQVHPMPSRLNVILRTLLACGSAVTLAVAAESGQPWTDTFTMPIGGQERTFAEYQGSSFLVLAPNDANNKGLLLGKKDVVIAAKFERDGVATARQRVRLSSFPDAIAEGDAALFAAKLEGDNLYFFGTLTTPDSGKSRFEIRAVESAPSDAQIIANQLAGLLATDYAGRLKAANLIRERAVTQPNKEFWLAASDNIIAQVIDDASAAASKTKDVALLNQAVSWAIDVLHDTTKAGRVASATWLKGTPGADDVAKRLRRLGMESYKDLWRPRAEALSMEFEDRFADISWKDADQYYRLGRWSDLHGEYLPRAKDRSYRCYQAGYRANPNHQGIRNELGLPNTVRGDGTQTQVSADYQHPETGTLVPAPRGWKRGDRIEGDITWVDPQSETAYVAAAVIETPDNPNLDQVWQNIEATLRSRPEFAIIEQDEPTFPQGLARRIRFSFREGRYVRQHELILALNPTARAAVRLDAGYAEDEQVQVHQILLSTFDRLVIPNERPNQPGK